MHPKVSIVSVSYNQEKYIRDTLESFVMQKTDFEFEIIIGDDHSSDKTPEIIQEYAAKYPNLIRPILNKQNVGVAQNFINVLQAAKGDYIALCEGDDYWTDPQKLQLQADFLDKHTDYALCFHSVRVFFEDESEKEFIYPATKNANDFNLEELLKENFIQTNSVMYRRQKDYAKLPVNILPIDWYLHLYHAQFGKIGFIDKVMSAYRRHPGGVWWDSHHNINNIWIKHGLAHLALYVEFLKLYDKNETYGDIIHGHIGKILYAMIEVDKRHKQTLLRKALREFPHAAEVFIISLDEKLRSREKILDARNHEIDRLRQVVHDKERHIQHLTQELNLIKASKVWKLRNKAVNIIGKNKIGDGK
ncbi:MAG TPA: glycosyltransferase [Candidatus Saccharimonadales bacterium]|nr:glycosyltransferase [Candidatus Saccharimonadales bacterium]